MVLVLKVVTFLLVLACGNAAGMFDFMKGSSGQEFVTEPNLVRGVPPVWHNKYLIDKFVCDSGSVILDKAEVNDGYCDCLDNSDEPGTSACAGNKFSCINDGYKLIEIDSSRVDDGVCDCCDGSDEGVIAACPNTCFQVGLHERAEKEQRRTAYIAGAAARARLIDTVKKEKEPLIQQLGPLTQEIDKLTNDIALYDGQIRSVEEKVQESREQILQGSFSQAMSLLNVESLGIESVAFMLSNLLDLVPASKEGVAKDDKDDTVHPVDVGDNDYDHHDHPDLDDYDSEYGRGYDDDGDYNPDGAADGADEVDEPSCSTADPSTCSEREQEFVDKWEKMSHPEASSQLDRLQGMLTGGHVNKEAAAWISQRVHILEQITSRDSITHTDKESMDIQTDTSPKDEDPPTNPCVLVQLTDDSRLADICSSAGDASDMDKAMSKLFDLLHDNAMHNEVALTIGFFLLHKSFTGSAAYVRSVLQDGANICPADFASLQAPPSPGDSKAPLDICSLGERLGGISSSMTVELAAADQQDAEAVPAREKKIEAVDRKSALEAQKKSAEEARSEYNTYSDSLEFLSLKGQCFELLDGKYTYSVCAMDKVTQRDTGMQASLGKFKELIKAADGSSYSLHYDNGDHCWGIGEPRKAEVTVECGAEHRLKVASEPSTCHYSFVLESPMACTEEYALLNGLSTG